jgi:hypothetical protein
MNKTDQSKIVGIEMETLEDAIKYITARCHGLCCFDKDAIRCIAHEQRRRHGGCFGQLEAVEFAQMLKKKMEAVK